MLPVCVTSLNHFDGGFKSLSCFLFPLSSNVGLQITSDDCRRPFRWLRSYWLEGFSITLDPQCVGERTGNQNALAFKRMAFVTAHSVDRSLHENVFICLRR